MYSYSANGGGNGGGGLDYSALYQSVFGPQKEKQPQDQQSQTPYGVNDGGYLQNALQQRTHVLDAPGMSGTNQQQENATRQAQMLYALPQELQLQTAQMNSASQLEQAKMQMLAQMMQQRNQVRYQYGI